MNALRVPALAAIALSVSAFAWMGWPRPDAEIRVALGGVATVVDRYGRSSPLGDTVVVGGAGARRAVRVVNRDTVQHVLAMFTVAAGAQQDFAVPPGSFGGYCTAHAAGTRLTVVVR